jgi:hypothetical protein
MEIYMFWALVTEIGGFMAGMQLYDMFDEKHQSIKLDKEKKELEVSLLKKRIAELEKSIS